ASASTCGPRSSRSRKRCSLGDHRRGCLRPAFALHQTWSRNDSYFQQGGLMATHVQQPAPHFSCEALVNGAFKDVSLSDYKGKYLVLFFYPLDFTFVCPTEILAFN